MNLDGYDNSMYYLVFMGGDDKITHVETDCKNGRTLVIFKRQLWQCVSTVLNVVFENIYVCDMRYFELNAIDFASRSAVQICCSMNTFSATGGNKKLLKSNRVGKKSEKKNEKRQGGDGGISAAVLFIVMEKKKAGYDLAKACGTKLTSNKQPVPTAELCSSRQSS